MLAPPGSGATRAKGVRRSTAKAESPDDVIRQLQKLPPNKKCADCSSKLPSYVNLTVGSFVCMACAGIHRELSARVKGVGHSSFTPEEAAQMKTMDNEKVNLIWLARYNPLMERMKPPTDNTNQHQLKSWIFRKYNEKQWYAEPGSDGPSSGAPAPAERQSRNVRPSEPQPTMVQLPPVSQQPPGGGNVLPADHSFPADFGSSQARSAFPADPPQQAPPQPPPENFANFDAHIPPAQQQQPVQNFANFDAPHPPDTGGAGGFANFDQHQALPPQQQQNFGHQAPQQQQNFDNFPMQQQQQQNFGNFPTGQQQQNLGNFPTGTQQNQPPKQPPVANFPGFHSPTREASPRPVVGSSPLNKPKPGSPPPHAPPPPLPTMDHASPAVNLKAAPIATKVELKQGQTVYYKTDGAAVITKILLEDGEPFYTIKLLSSGKEKQTTEGNLHVDNPIPSLLQNIVKKLDDVQLKSVYDFAVATLQHKPTPATITSVPDQKLSPKVAPKNQTDPLSGPPAMPSAMPPVASATTAAEHHDDEDPFAHLGPAGAHDSDEMPAPVPGGGIASNNSGGTVPHKQLPGIPNQQMMVQPHQQPAGRNNQMMMTQQHQGLNMFQQPNMQQTKPQATHGPASALQQQRGNQHVSNNMSHAQGQMMMHGQMQGSGQMLQGGVSQNVNQQMVYGHGMSHQNQQMMHGQGMPQQSNPQMMQGHGMSPQNHPQMMQGYGMPQQNVKQMTHGMPHNNQQMMQGHGNLVHGQMGGGMMSHGGGAKGPQQQMPPGNAGMMAQGGAMQQQSFPQQQQQGMMFQQQQPGMGNTQQQQHDDPFASF